MYHPSENPVVIKFIHSPFTVSRLVDKSEIDTPALIVDVDVMIRNIRDMAKFAKERGLKLRPHVKTHKAPQIAKMQVEEGGNGICVQKLGEAEVMAEYGLDNIFITNEVVGRLKLSRLAKLREKIEVFVAVDHLDNIRDLSNIMRDRGLDLGVYVDVDCGMHRTGVPPEKAPDLAEAITRSEGLYLVGIMAYEGHAGAPLGREERKNLIRKAMEQTLFSVKLVERKGIEVNEVSVGSSATVRYSGMFEGITELQPGMYIFNDYYLVEREAATVDTCALHVLTTVMSRPSPDRGVIDAGSKTFHFDMNRYPIAVGVEGVEIVKFSEEHGWLTLKGEAQHRIRLGDRLEFIPYHVCPCVNQFDTLYGLKGDKVQYMWTVAARGKVT
ncbi:D-threonine aldolase [Candidatus Calditenuaceae archaeon HR02]|nr:D-threonine aldolase [Candidatus Calditenuaceae archaeon HR02]